MSEEWPRVVGVEPIGDYRLRLTYDDGFVGEVDFAETISRGGIFSFLKNPARFKAVEVAHLGTALLWIDDDGDEIDFCADALRIKAETNSVASLAAE